MKFIGITGGIGAGKSEIIHYMQKHYNCEVYLADEVAHEVQRKGTECHQKLVQLLGGEILNADGEIERKKMAEIIFNNPKLLKQVNALIHPAVRNYLLTHLELAKKSGMIDLFVVEAALLIETGYKDLVDEMWYVHADPDIRAERLRKSRGYSEQKIDQIMKSQLSEDAFRNACDFVIENNGDVCKTFQQIDKKLEAYAWKE